MKNQIVRAAVYREQRGCVPLLRAVLVPAPIT
jgi:hypothetical protein